MSWLNLHNPWLLCGIGILFCVTGLYFFFRNVYEEGESLYWPIVTIVMGVLLIALGTARYFKLIG